MKSLDKEEFNSSIKKRVMQVINDYKLIEPNEHIAVALSGGKDSLLTLYMLKELQNDLDFKMTAIAVDEGIKGYRSHGMEAAQINAEKLGIKLVTKSFIEESGFSLDQVYSQFKSACIPCGVFRRYILNKTAYELNVDKIATGHNLDDEIQSFLMSFARGDTIKFAKFGPILDQIHPKLIPRIKPLWDIPEKEVGIWAVLNDIEVHFDECPYSVLSLRAKTKNFLNRAESDNPGTKRNIMTSFKKTFLETELKQVNAPKLKECQICGEPTSGKICKACELTKLIKNNNESKI